MRTASTTQETQFLVGAQYAALHRICRVPTTQRALVGKGKSTATMMTFTICAQDVRAIKVWDDKRQQKTKDRDAIDRFAMITARRKCTRFPCTPVMTKMTQLRTAPLWKEPLERHGCGSKQFLGLATGKWVASQSLKAQLTLAKPIPGTAFAAALTAGFLSVPRLHLTPAEF